MKKEIIEKIWVNFKDEIISAQGLPAWTKILLQINSDALYDQCQINIKGQSYSFSYECKAVSQSYIDFLKEQIELNPRGEDWKHVLQSRLKALSQFLGKELMFMEIQCEENQLYARIDLDSLAIIHWEII